MKAIARLGKAAQENRTEVGAELYQFAHELFPICRSITGDGLRETLRYLQRDVPLEVVEVPSGTEVLDWTIPPE